MSISDFRFWRKYKGGIWFKYQMTGQLPGCYGSFWSRNKFNPHRYYDLIKTEDYTKKATK